MKLKFDHDEPGPQKWYAYTDDSSWDGSGVTPLDAISELAIALEKEVNLRRLIAGENH